MFKRLAVRALTYGPLSFFLLVSLYPLIWLLFYSFKDNEEIFSTNVFGIPGEWRWENYSNAFGVFDIVAYFKNSLIVSIGTVVFTGFLALMFSYAAARMRWRFANISRIYMTSGMFIPMQIILIPLLILVRDMHLQNSYFAVIVPYVAFQLSFATIIFYAFFRSLPYEIEESAAIDGASVYTTFFRIMVPLVKPAIASVSIFVFLFAWNEFLVALIMISDNALKTLPLGLLYFQTQFGSDWGAMGAVMVISTIPTIVVYLLFSEQIEKALTVSSAVKG
ncbi:sugar ABC transporter permease [Cohnella sp. CIP 111063]|uniref:carbohydrate ABC transporter permease n=1 Tax=unclassified Cohnella TaxID=2636738 RepID=UPI000B8BF087|nr:MULTISPECIES: carbohydrate ABC transporter permease [unclassified Cohnella]OXS53347.1 sugar ABC transporter permease [Cohnella sp. CIP 111063]PRX61089.1 carbohydrate ABC transporter membrane protein 2 (CUT1 family) [Cohnella sp. SGD-V74]